MIDRVVRLKRDFLLSTGLFSLAGFLLALIFGGFSLAKDIFAGFTLGICDNYIMFMGVEKGVKKYFADAAPSMSSSMIKRLIFDGVAIFVAVKAGIKLLPLFIAYILIHVMCLVFIVVAVRREDKANFRSAERREKDAREQNN